MQVQCSTFIIIFLSRLMLHAVESRGVQIFKKYKIHFEILDARVVT